MTATQTIRIETRPDSYSQTEYSTITVSGPHRVPDRVVISRDFTTFHGSRDHFPTPRLLAVGMYYDDMASFLNAWEATEVTA